MLIALLSFSYYSTKLEIDASADTLLLDDDKDLAFKRTVDKRFSTSDFMVITYTPKEKMLSTESLETLKSLHNSLSKVDLVKSVESILTVPLLLSPTREIQDLAGDARTLESNNIDKVLVKKEFLNNPLYVGNLVSKDFKTSTIILKLYKDKIYSSLLEQKNIFLKKARISSLSPEELKLLKKVKKDFKIHRDRQRESMSKGIKQIRNIMQTHKSEASLFLGGVGMISNDIVSFVKSDLLVYGISLVLLLILILSLLFRKVKWVVIPLSICLLSVLAITSSLGFFGWEITVISSNFIALQLIITISIVLHLIVRYEELLSLYPRASHKRIVLLTMLSKITPTSFAVLTTIAGFGSLLLSKIYPIINLGWMMSAGIFLSLIISFIFFPTLALLFKKGAVRTQNSDSFLPSLATRIIQKDRVGIYLVVVLTLIFAFTGASKLIIENSFIDYFKQDTQIYKSMKVIDQELGGTTPLDIIITFKDDTIDINMEADEEDEFADEFADDANAEQYWFTPQRLELAIQIHDYLKSLPQIGDVQSLASLLKIGKLLNNNEDLDSIKLAILYTKIPQEYRDIVLSPYLNIEHNQMRFATRIMDSNKNLRRDALLKKITYDIDAMLDPQVATLSLSNLMVLYNNLLQSLFKSQITTLGTVLIILALMFLLLFRSVLITSIALVVNVIPIGIVFGFMGWLHIPLDVMTITIAAIAIGIGVDNTIHYLYRFKDEIDNNSSYLEVVRATNKSVGEAMFFTTLSIIIGFSILMLSNLVPTVYFALLTIVAMVSALISNLLLLPKLLILFKPFK